MGPTVADLTAARLEKPPERPVAVSAVVGPPAHRPQPKIPVQLGRANAVGLVAADRIGIVPALDAAHLADHAVAEIGRRGMAVGGRAALRADLYGDLVFLGRRDHRLSLVDGAARRLLHVDMLAPFRRVHHLHGVPVIGRGHHDAVDVLAIEDIAIIAIHVDVRAGRFRGVGESVLIDVANRGNVHLVAVGSTLHVTQVIAAHAAHADMAEGEPLVGPGNLGGDQVGEARRGRRGGQKLASFHRQPSFPQDPFEAIDHDSVTGMTVQSDSPDQDFFRNLPLCERCFRGGSGRK